MADVQITTPILDAQGQLATPSVLSQIDARADARVKVRVPDSGTAGQVLQRTATGTAWADAPKGGSALVLSGPGRPDVPSTTAGTITGNEPVGAEFRSTDGAQVGAWTWRKRPTGWVVTDGDTGWRTLWTTTTSTGNAVTLNARRLAGTVHYRAFANGSIPVSGNTIIFAPREFFPDPEVGDGRSFALSAQIYVSPGNALPALIGHTALFMFGDGRFLYGWQSATSSALPHPWQVHMSAVAKGVWPTAPLPGNPA